MKQEGSIYKEVRTLHITFWYEKWLDITEIIDQYVSDGYHPQINTKEQKSIPEIDHIHFIKVLEYL